MSTQVEFENELYRIYWHSPERAILMVEVYERWTWHDALVIVKHGNEILQQVQHDKYLICHLMGDASKLPVNNRLAIAIIRKLIQLDPSEEELAYFVGRFSFLRRLINTRGEISALMRKTQKYHYAREVSTALEEIAIHKAQKLSSLVVTDQ